MKIYFCVVINIMEFNFSIARIILFTYIIIASQYCSNLFSNGLKTAIQNNRMVQHLILIILIMSLLIICGNPLKLEITNNHQLNVVIMSLLIYIWFIMTTKLDLSWNIGILILLTIYFLYEDKKINDLEFIFQDKNLGSIAKQNMMKKFHDYQKYILISIFGVTIIGTLFYANEKQTQYGGGEFSYVKFFFD